MAMASRKNTAKLARELLWCLGRSSAEIEDAQLSLGRLKLLQTYASTSYARSYCPVGDAVIHVTGVLLHAAARAFGEASLEGQVALGVVAGCSTKELAFATGVRVETISRKRRRLCEFMLMRMIAWQRLPDDLN